MRLGSLTSMLSVLDVQGYWLLLLVPLSLGISVVYRAIHCDDIRTLPVPVLKLWGEIVVSLLGLGIAIYLVLDWTLD